MTFNIPNDLLYEINPLRVLSYNIHKGFSFSNRKFVLRQIREALKLVHPDLVFLQEVIGQHDTHAQNLAHWPKTAQFEYIAESLWPHFAYGKNAIYHEGHHGNAILSKFPILNWENIDISTHKMESRGLLHAVIDAPGRRGPLHGICLHLGLFEKDRKKQVEHLCHRITQLVPHHEPLVVAGDFNDWRQQITRPLQRKVHLKEAFLELHQEHPRTFPSWMPMLKLDRIYYRGLHAANAECWTGKPWNALSDHAAVFAELYQLPL